jgi:hypothetical protein
VAVFADLEQFPQCHAFGVGDDASGLVGYDGASAIDFHGNRYRTQRNGDPPEESRVRTAVLAIA